MADQNDVPNEIAAERRDQLLLKLLKTPPQPRPVRERVKKSETDSRGTGEKRGDG